MGEAILWWVTLQLLGIIAFPIGAFVLRSLPDRGYAVAKVLGLLLTGWLAYILAMLHLLPFGRALLLLCAVAIGGFSTWLLMRKGKTFLREVQAHIRDRAFLSYVLAAELLFTVAFIAWALLRAHDPNIFGTEKFMDFGFMNAIAKSQSFPPNDMWLSGHPINYYYFGYVLMASLSMLSGVPTQVGYNLANVTLFSLTALGAFGVAYNLIVATTRKRSAATSQSSAHVTRAETTRKPAPKKAQSKPQRALPAEAAAPSVPTRRVHKTSRVPSSQMAESASVAATLTSPTEESFASESNNDLPRSEGTAVNGREPKPRLESTNAYDSPALFHDTARRAPWFLSPYLFGLLAALMVVGMGHLTTVFAVHDGSPLEGNGWRYCFNCNSPGRFDWFAPSRVIADYKYVSQPGQAPQKLKEQVDPINEFPAFSFVLSDMHPHVMALPIWMLALYFVLALSRRHVRRVGQAPIGGHRELLYMRILWGIHALAILAILLLFLTGRWSLLTAAMAAIVITLVRIVLWRSTWLDDLPRGLGAWLMLFLVGLVVGSLYVTNTWDYPTFLLLVLSALALPYLAWQRRSDQPSGWRWTRPWLLQSFMIAVISLLLFLPFHLTFKSLVGSQPAEIPANLANIPVLGWILQKLGALVAVNPWDKGIVGFLVIFGIFLIAILVWLAYEMGRYLAQRREDAPVAVEAGVLSGVFVLIVAVAVLLRFPLLALLLPMAIICLYLVWREPEITHRNLVLVMVALTALIALAIEVVYLRDIFNARQNTIFKFYYQVWVAWAIAAAYGSWRVSSAIFTQAFTARALPTVVMAVAGVFGVWVSASAQARLSESLAWGLLAVAGLWGLLTALASEDSLIRSPQLRAVLAFIVTLSGLMGLITNVLVAATFIQWVLWFAVTLYGCWGIWAALSNRGEMDDDTSVEPGPATEAPSDSLVARVGRALPSGALAIAGVVGVSGSALASRPLTIWLTWGLVALAGVLGSLTALSPEDPNGRKPMLRWLSGLLLGLSGLAGVLASVTLGSPSIELVLWVLVAIYGGLVASVSISNQIGTTSALTRLAAAGLLGVFLVLVGTGLNYTVMAYLGKTAPPARMSGLDGTTHLRESAPGDYEAINWLKQTATGNDVVVECCRDEYNNPGHAGRVSSYTGVPTLISWGGHEAQWRGGQPELIAEAGSRRGIVTSIYTARPPANTAQGLLQTLQQYGVDYVFVGATERGEGNAAGSDPGERVTAQAEALFKQALTPVFTSTVGSTVIYKVGEGTTLPPLPTPTPVPQVDPNVPPVRMFTLGTPGINRGQFNAPRGIARDAEGNFYVVDTGNLRIQKFDATGNWLAMFGNGRGDGDGQFKRYEDPVTAAEAMGTGPAGIAVDPSGNVYVADTWNHRIQKFDKDGTFLASWGSFIYLADASAAADPERDRKFYGPRGLAIGPGGDLYVTDTGNKRVLVFDQNGTFKRKIESGVAPGKTAPDYKFDLPGEMNEPMGIAVDTSGNVYVADRDNHRIQKFDNTGKAVAQWPVPNKGYDNSGAYPEPFLAVDNAGNVFSTLPVLQKIAKFSPTGQLLGEKDKDGSTTLTKPTGITVSADGTIYVVDTEGNGVVKFGSLP